MTTEKVPHQAPPAPDNQYDPPRVERSLSPDELEREVHYAGSLTASLPG